MSESATLVGWLEDRSDWLSPIVVKEVRQIVRGRDFNYSFTATLVISLAIAFFAAGQALSGSGTTGSWTFVALMGGLTLLGMVVVPLGAFSTLRNERMEQTLELITVTALSPRRIVIGKLLAQAVKLATLFAAIAPFIAMSFLLGGIDFVTILISLAVLFMWSLWACAACLFLSTLLKSRAMSGLVFGAAGIVLFLVFVIGRSLFAFSYGIAVAGSGSGSGSWWMLGITTAACVMTTINLILLAENRLSVPTEDRVTPLRIGFLLQFLLIAGLTFAYFEIVPPTPADASDVLGLLGGLHLAIVAMFAATEDLVVPRRVLLRMRRASAAGWLLAIFRPGGGRGAAYVLAQMLILVAVTLALRPSASSVRWLLALCGYICFFTGVPALVWRYRNPAAETALQLRIAVLMLLPITMLLPDVFYYVLWRPDVFDLSYGRRHLLNPFRTLANWSFVETSGWSIVPLVIGLTGLVAYCALIGLGRRTTAQEAVIDDERLAVAEGEPGSANALY